MPKQPETQDRFRIYAETSLEQMGPLIAVLTRMGVQNIGHELITDVVTFNKRPRNSEPDVATSTADALVAYATKHPAFKLTGAIKKLEKNGIDVRTIVQVAGALVRKKVLKKVMAGHYQFIGQASTETPKTPNKTKRGGRRLEISNREFLWTEFKDRSSFSAAEVIERFKTKGRNAKSATSVLSQLNTEGFVHRRGEGLYAPVVGKGLPYKSSGVGLNGSTPAAQGAVDHA